MIQVGPAGASGGIADVMRFIDEWLRSTGRQTEMINTSSDGSLPARVAAGCAGILRARASMRSSPLAIVHVHSASNGSFLRKSIVVALARVYGRPILLHIHGGGFSAFAANGTRLRRAWIAAVLRQADAVCVVNEPTLRTVQRLQPAAQTTILTNPATMLCGRLTDPNSCQVLFLGRLGPTKGTDTLLEAIRRLQTAGVEADYVLTGDGDVEGARRVVAGLPAPDRAHVTGWLSASKVHALLHQSSVFCLPSRFEGLPMALLQAMGHGLACVVTPVGGMREVVTDGVDGIQVGQDDPDALVVALRTLLEDTDLRARLGLAAARRVEDLYSPDVFTKRLVVLYQRVRAARSERVNA